MSLSVLLRKFNFSFCQSSVQILSPVDSVFIPSCSAGTGIKGTTRNRYKYSRKRRGWKAQDGDYVTDGHAIATQRKPRWWPGANVIAGRRRTLTAVCCGTVRYTKEIWIPGKDTLAARTVKDLPKGALLYKTFVNVVPAKEVGRFRLIKQVWPWHY